MRKKTVSMAAVFVFSLAAMPTVAIAQRPLVSSPVNGTLGLNAATPLKITWTTVPNASEYLVELSQSPSFVPLLALKDPQIPARAGPLEQSYVVEFSDDTALHAGRKYYWRVSATISGTRVSSEAAMFSTAGDPFGWLAKHNVSLTRAEDGVDKDKPATVAFIRQGGNMPSEQVVAEFLLGWEGKPKFIPRQGGFALSPTLSFAGKMSSDREAEDTLAKVAGGLVADWSFGQKPTKSVYQTFDVAYEGDQVFDEANLLAGYLVTYSGQRIGRFYPTKASSPVQFLVRPYLLAAFGKKINPPDSMPSDTQTRIGPQIDVKLRLNALARALGISGTLLSVTDRWYSLSGVGRDDANYFTASLEFQVAKGFTFGYSYKSGRDAPAFKGVNRMALTVGLGFGR